MKIYERRASFAPTHMSTYVLESEKGRASWICLRISPWQYSGLLHGATTDPFSKRVAAATPRNPVAAAAATRAPAAITRRGDVIVVVVVIL